MRNREKDKYLQRNCLICNAPIFTLKTSLNKKYSSKNQGKFCSKECRIDGQFKRQKYINKRGYVDIAIRKDGKVKYYIEHIKIMEAWIKRKIDSSKEDVHHINGIKDDNRIENLQLLKTKEHMNIHLRKNFGKCRLSDCNNSAEKTNLCQHHYNKEWRKKNGTKRA